MDFNYNGDCAILQTKQKKKQRKGMFVCRSIKVEASGKLKFPNVPCKGRRKELSNKHFTIEK